MWRLFYAFRYFRLDNAEKRGLDLWPTLVLAALIATPFLVGPGANFFGANGFLDKLLLLTGPLTGFYVAALVAAATFSHPDLDKTIQSGPVALITRDVDGNRVRDLLTRREFVCTIFGYLAFAAFALSVIAVVLVSLSSLDRAELSTWAYIGFLFGGLWWSILRGVTICFLVAATCHIIVATCLGIYYLMDRLYRRDRQIVTRKPGSEAANG
jgi:hypothetical protein